MYTNPIMSFFPLKDPRNGQVAVLKEMDKVFKEGKKFIIFEGPVGCGKSAMALTLARAFNSAHVLTPRKSLQNQYFDDFHEHSVLMKGRNSYPCTQTATPSYRKFVLREIANGHVAQPMPGSVTCGTAPCRSDQKVYRDCIDSNGTCPYNAAIEVAQANPIIIHNIHSFIFQTTFGAKFQKRELIVVDEAHEIEGVVREFISKKFTVKGELGWTDRPENQKDLDSWAEFFLQDRFVPKLTAGEKQLKEEKPDWVSPLDEYLNKVQILSDQKDYYQDRFCVKATVNYVGSKALSTTFKFVPDKLGNAASNLLFDYGEHVVLMSGTIYDKKTFCNNLGISFEQAHFIRVSSTFPLETRPIYAKSKYQVDTSFAMWDQNFPDMMNIIEEIMGVFDDAKGLIHTSSYETANQVMLALPPGRAITHNSSDFQEKLQMFYDSKEPLVFISPVCQQGVDFKHDRARFQIVTRVPYANTNDEFINYKVTNDFPWYNYQALVVFGQILGRVNRSEDDYGATFLIDSRFNKFITKNLKIIPKWVRDAIIWK